MTRDLYDVGRINLKILCREIEDFTVKVCFHQESTLGINLL